MAEILLEIEAELEFRSVKLPLGKVERMAKVIAEKSFSLLLKGAFSEGDYFRILDEVVSQTI